MSAFADAPRAGSAEAKVVPLRPPPVPVVDAPRAGSAEAKIRVTGILVEVSMDAPRAGSAEAKVIHAPTSIIAL